MRPPPVIGKGRNAGESGTAERRTRSGSDRIDRAPGRIGTTDGETERRRDGRSATGRGVGADRGRADSSGRSERRPNAGPLQIVTEARPRSKRARKKKIEKNKKYCKKVLTYIYRYVIITSSEGKNEQKPTRKKTR